MKKSFLLLSAIFQLTIGLCQTSYKDSATSFIKNYIDNHEVVKGEDRKQLHFYPVNEKYRVTVRFEQTQDAQWFQMHTSGRMKQVYRV